VQPTDGHGKTRLPALLLVALLLFVLLGIQNGWIPLPRRPPAVVQLTAEQEQFAAKVEALGGTVVFDADADGQPAAEVSLRATKVTDDDLAFLEDMPHLKRLWLDDTKISDAGMPHLAKLVSLEFLILNGTAITDRGLEHLKGLSQLTTLSLDGTKVTNDGLAHLKDMTGLRLLALEGTKVTDAGLEHLKGFSGLAVLELAGSQVTDKGVEALRKALPEAGIYR
jgi:hypothetical protein